MWQLAWLVGATCTLLTAGFSTVSFHRRSTTPSPQDKLLSRVVGGTPANLQEYPFMVSVQIWNKHYCGGSLISVKWVLTAAHCLIDVNDESHPTLSAGLVSAVMGTTDVHTADEVLQRRQAEHLCPHSGFKFEVDMPDDIGLIEVSQPFVLEKRVQLAHLPKIPVEGELNDTFRCAVAGWGTTQKLKFGQHATAPPPRSLMKAVVVLVSLQRCRWMMGVSIPETATCAGVDPSGGRDSCQGDSGGPLMCNGTQVGVASWGFGCATSRSAGVYTRVDRYLGWIQRVRNDGATVRRSTWLITMAGLVAWQLYGRVGYLYFQLVQRE